MALKASTRLGSSARAAAGNVAMQAARSANSVTRKCRDPLMSSSISRRIQKRTGALLREARHRHAFQIKLNLFEGMALRLRDFNDHKPQCDETQNGVQEECAGVADRRDEIEEGCRDDEVEDPVRHGRKTHGPTPQRQGKDFGDEQPEDWSKPDR